MDRTELGKILAEHKKWLTDEGGKRADLSGADLSGAHLRGADLRYTDLRDADLSGADLSGAHLRGADLRDADLRGANLRYTDLRDADLSGADLSGAHLRGADLRDADLDYSCWPLWCGSKEVKVDNRLVFQLAAHICVLDCETPEFRAIKDFLMPYARQCHRAAELGLEGGSE